VQAKIDLCNVLGDIEIAQSILKSDASKATEGEADHPLDQHYKTLKCDMKTVSPSDPVWKTISSYVAATRPDLKLLQVFEVDRSTEGARFNTHADLGNRKLLWHGTNVAGTQCNGSSVDGNQSQVLPSCSSTPFFGLSKLLPLSCSLLSV